MRVLAWEVYFRPFDLDKSTVLMGRYEAKPLADKIADLFQWCVTEGEVVVVRNEKAKEPS